jgi:hypothetical protein
MDDRLNIENLKEYFFPPGKDLLLSDKRSELMKKTEWGNNGGMVIHVVTIDKKNRDEPRFWRFAFVKNVKDLREKEVKRPAIGIPTRKARSGKTIQEMATICIEEELKILDFKKPGLLSIREDKNGVFHAIFWAEAVLPDRVSRFVKNHQKTAIEAFSVDLFSLPLIRGKHRFFSKIMGDEIYPAHLGMIAYFFKARPDLDEIETDN